MGLFEFSLPPTSSEGELSEPKRSSNLQPYASNLQLTEGHALSLFC